MYQRIQQHEGKQAFTPQKTQSTLHTNPQNTSESKYHPEHFFKTSSLLEVQSIMSFGQTEIKREEVLQFLNSMKIINFLSKEVKSLSRMITAKQKSVQSLSTKKQQQLAKIDQIKSEAEIKTSALKQQRQKIVMRRKQKNKVINYEINRLTERIRRIKSLGFQEHSISRSQLETSITNKSFTHKHRRLYSERCDQKQPRRSKVQQIFTPIYIPYPVFHNFSNYPQSHQYPISYNSINLQRPYYSLDRDPINELSNNQSTVNGYLNSQIQQSQKQTKMKQFNSKLKESLTNRQTPSGSRKQSQRIPKQQSLRNSCKSGSSKSQLKPKLSFKAPFETDDEHAEQRGKNSFISKNNNYSKMGYKITSSNTCEEQILQLRKRETAVQRIKIIEQIENSTINLQIPSDKKENSSWEKDTIQRLRGKQPKKVEHRVKEKKKNNKSSSEVQIQQSGSVNSSLNGDNINIVLTQSPIKNYPPPPLQKKGFSSSESDVQNIQAHTAKGIKIKPVQNIKNQDSANEVDSSVQILDITSSVTDQDVIGTINLAAESKISRNSYSKRTIEVKEKHQQKRQDEDQILSLINLAPESRISRLSRQKQKSVKGSRSELKQIKLQTATEDRTAISDLRQIRNQKELLSSSQNQKSSHQYETELRTTTPSRIIKKGFKAKPNYKNTIDLMSASIKEASQEEQSNSVSDILLKKGKKSNHKNR